MTKVLIVDDDLQLGEEYLEMLPKEEFQVELVSDGNEAFLALKKFQPDVIILDLVIPGEDGFLLLSRFRGNPATADVPILICSNLDEQDDIDRALNMGAAAFLKKSDLTQESLKNKINEALASADSL